MAVTAATFRVDFPEFADVAKYPDAVVNFYIAFATFFLPVSTWGIGSTAATSPPTTGIDFAAELVVAHNLVLERQAFLASAGGGIPGLQSGVVQSKSVGPASLSYNVELGSYADAGIWNMTVYGRRFWDLLSMFGAPPMQIGIGTPPPWTLGPWPGIVQWPGWGIN